MRMRGESRDSRRMPETELVRAIVTTTRDRFHRNRKPRETDPIHCADTVGIAPRSSTGCDDPGAVCVDDESEKTEMQRVQSIGNCSISTELTTAR